MERADELPVVDYTRGGTAHPSIYARPAQPSSVPNKVRQDFSRYQRDQALAARGQHEDRASMRWADLRATQAAYEESGQTVVTFDKGLADLPQPGYDHLGRPMARNRGGRR
jgi:hypothetical protein